MKGVLAILCVIALLALGISSCASCGSRPAPRPVSVQSVVACLTPLARLDSLRVDISGVVEATQAPQWAIDSPSRLVLIVRGSALYAVPDLDQARVVLTDGAMRVRLSSPAVVESWVDVASSQIWERRGGVLGPASPELDSAAWAAAAAMVREAASTPSHLAQARQQAESVIISLAAKVVPDRRVEIEWSDGA